MYLKNNGGNMKKKLLSFMLAICLMMPCAFMLSACDKETTPDNPPEAPAVVYTVTESEWEINFNITKAPEQAQPQAEPLACMAMGNQAQLLSNDSSQPLAKITSYTLRAEGWAEGDEPGEQIDGLGILKVAPNGMEMEFYLENVLRPDESGKTPSSDPWYIGMTTMLNSYFPFSGKYDTFTFDSTKNAYVAERLKTTVVDEDDINKTYDLYNKKAEVTFINGYLNTITVEMCDDETYENVYLSLVFTFSNINNTTVDI